MKFYIPVVLWATLLASSACTQGTAPPNQDVAAMYRSDHAGERYDFTVLHTQLLATPDWPQSADNPPLAPRQALAYARADLAKFLPDAAQWVHPQIALQEVGAPDKWIYIIRFEGPLPAGVSDGAVDTMRVPVLMNGTAIGPVITRSNL